MVGFFLFIFSKSIKISRNTTDLFAKYLSFGISFQIIVQALINLAVVVGLIPVTGITLPFKLWGLKPSYVAYRNGNNFGY